jgi:hypothetical protein
MTARARNGRYISAERTTTETTTTSVTERITVGETLAGIPSPGCGAPARASLRADGIDELDPRFPVRLSGGSPVFWHLIRRPPVKARWRARLGFTVDETARAVLAEDVQQEAFVRPLEETAPLPVAAVPVPRVYPELAEAALAREFTGPGAIPLGLDRSI